MLCPLLLTTQAFAQEAENFDGPEYTWEDETDPLVAGSHHGMRVIEVCEKVIEVGSSVYEDGEDYSTVDIEIFVGDYSLPLGYDDWDFLSIGLCDSDSDSDADQPDITIADIAVQSFIDWIDANYHDVVPLEGLVVEGVYGGFQDTRYLGCSIQAIEGAHKSLTTLTGSEPDPRTICRYYITGETYGTADRDGMVDEDDIAPIVIEILTPGNP